MGLKEILRTAGSATCVGACALAVANAGALAAQPTRLDGGSLVLADPVTPELPAEVRVKGERAVERAIAYLRSQQDAATGGWSVSAEGPNFPAITALVVTGMSFSPGIDGLDPSVARGIEYILSKRQADGGFYDRILPQYNTAICVSALARFRSDSRVEPTIGPALAFLRSLQYWEGADGDSLRGEASAVGREHAFYGGVGYGNRGRPDISNLQFALQAMQDAGVPGDDPFVQRAMVFLQRVQMDGRFNDQAYAQGSRQGGFIYATAENADTIGQGQSFAGTIEETLSDGVTASRLRSYGSVTYAGFKSYVYARLERDDPRVLAAMGWIARNYTVDENPGIGTDGQYYYYLTMARAMAAAQIAVLDVVGPDGTQARADWRVDLIDKLATLQEPTGAMRSVDDRWMENNPVLITAYSLIALQNALGRK